MLRQFVVLFFIPLELFPLPATDSTKDLLFTPLIVIVTLQHRTYPDPLLISWESGVLIWLLQKER